MSDEPTPARDAAFSRWLSAQQHDVDVDTARAGFDAGWEAAQRLHQAWLRETFTEIERTARVARYQGTYAYPLDHIRLQAEQALQALRQSQ